MEQLIKNTKIDILYQVTPLMCATPYFVSSTQIDENIYQFLALNQRVSIIGQYFNVTIFKPFLSFHLNASYIFYT